MATSVVEHIDVEPLHTSMHFLGCSPHEGAVFTDEVVDLTVSPSIALGGARGALVAVGMEAAVALCLYGLWQFWHHLR